MPYVRRRLFWPSAAQKPSRMQVNASILVASVKLTLPCYARLDDALCIAVVCTCLIVRSGSVRS